MRYGCLFFCLLLATTLLSGCLSAGHQSIDAPLEIPAEAGDVPPSKPIVTFEPASRAAGVDAEVGSTNVRVNQDSSGRDQNETTIAINPTNSQNMIGGANDARTGSWSAGYFVSQDGGASWTDGTMPFTSYSSQADPTVAYCADGTALFGYLDYLGSFQPHRLIVSRSTDGGATWLEPGTVYSGTTPFADKPWLTCDLAGGTFSNRAYISWTHFVNLFSGVIRIAWSDDHGLTWQGEKNLSGSGVQGSIPVPGRNGEVYVFWKGGSNIRFAKTTNGGGSWSAEATVASVDAISDTSFRRNSHPTAGIDISGGDYDGHVYVAWADDRDGDPDIYFSRSTDGGVTWDAPYRVNDDAVANGLDQFFPWLAVDDRGNVHLMWHDRRGDPDNQMMHIYIASSRDGGASFDRNLRVTDTPSDGSLTGFLGDYAALAAWDGKIVPLWSDLRPGTGEEDAYIEVEPVFDYDIVSGATFAVDKQTFSFDDQEPRLGNAITYDGILGDVAGLRGASPWSDATCIGEDLSAPPLVVPEVPAPGQAYYILLRAQGPRGDGSFGSGSFHSDPRDPLDEAPVCD